MPVPYDLCRGHQINFPFTINKKASSDMYISAGSVFFIAAISVELNHQNANK